MANAIGCANSQVAKLPAWQTYAQDQSAIKVSGKKAVSMTGPVLANTGQPDTELQQLIEEQGADHEPSPLDSRRTRVRANKKL